MNLYDFVVKRGWEIDIDSYDNVYDDSINVCVSREDLEEDNPEDNWYNAYIQKLMKRVEVTEWSEEDDDYLGWLTVAWSSLVQNNLKLFREWTKENWFKGNYEDDDDYICEWLKEIRLLMAGYGTESVYERHCELLNKIPEID